MKNEKPKSKFKPNQIVYLVCNNFIIEAKICAVMSRSQYGSCYVYWIENEVQTEEKRWYGEYELFASEKECVLNLIKNSRIYHYYERDDDRDDDYEQYTISKKLSFNK